MCRITDYQYTCKHHIQHTWSSCRGQIKASKDSNSKTPACQKLPSLYAKLATKCGSCSRAEAEQNLRRTLTMSKPNDQSPEDFESVISERLAKMATQIPTMNWRPLPSPVYSRKPSQKRLHTLRKNSLLRSEFKPEDACGPEAWEDNVVLPVYEAVEEGWNYLWTAETKSLADELAEDAERKRREMKEREIDGEDLDGEDLDIDGAEEDIEADEEDVGIEDEGEDEAEKEENDINSTNEPPEIIDAEFSESSASVYYRFRKTTRGCKAQVRHWELVEVWA